MSDADQTAEGWASSVSLPLDADGAFGRRCPECSAYFKVFLAEYGPVRERRWLACPSCGHVGDDESFITSLSRRISSTLR